MAKRIQRRARREVMSALSPQLQALQRAIMRSNSIYGQEQSALAPLPGQYRQSSGAILGNLQKALGAFGGTTGGYRGENAAAGRTMNAGARGALGILGAGQTSDLANATAALQAAAMQKKESAQNYLGQKQDVMAQAPGMILQRVDELRQQALQAQQIRAQIAAQQQAADLAQQQFGLDKRLGLAGLDLSQQQFGLDTWQAHQAANLAQQQFGLQQQQFALDKAAQEAELQGNQALADYYRRLARGLLGGGVGGGGAAPSSMPSPYSVPGAYQAPYAYKPRP